MILSFRTDMPGQTVQTQIRQSDQGLHCLPFSLHRLDSLLYGRATWFIFRVITTNFLGVRIFWKFMVYVINLVYRTKQILLVLKNNNNTVTVYMNF